MRVAFIFNPFRYKLHEENLRIVQKYFGLFPPLSMSWVAAIAEKAGHEAILIDARTLQLSPDEVCLKLKEFKPDILGFMMTTYMFRDTLDWIKHIKEKFPKAPVLIGGYNLRVYPKESLSHPEIDFGCLEHAYYTVPALLSEIEKGTRNFDDVPGLVYKKNGVPVITPHPEKIDFNLFPNPARHLLPNELYAEFPTELKNFTVMVTSLGCPRRCGFCEAGNTDHNPRAPETVLNEIDECYNEYGIREIDIFDYDFTANRKRVLEICDGIIKRGYKMIFACRARVDEFDEELLAKMKQAGFGRVYLGIESAVPEILKNVNKGITVERITETIRLTKKAGIRALGFFLVGAPGETRETFRRTVDFAKKLDLDYVQFSKCLAKPRTPLWKEMVQKEGKDYWQDWILGKEIDRPLPRPWTELTNEEIDNMARKAYISYHARFRFILRSLFKLKSFSEFRRKVSGFFHMLFAQEKVSTEDREFTAYNENRRGKLDFYKKISKWSRI